MLIPSAIPVIIAIITIYYNQKANNRSIKANIVAKARIEWIQEARNSISDFCTIVTEHSVAKEMFLFVLDFNKLDASHQEIIQTFPTKINGLKNKILLYFNEDDTNEQGKVIREKSEKISQMIFESDGQSDVVKTQIEVDGLMDAANKYFKKEWEKVKEIN